MQISKLYPECKDYVWGGENLIKNYGKKTDKLPCAESWELSFHNDGLTKLENGKTLLETVTQNELGENVKGFPFFPVLIKFIDAKQNLSIQVHPSDDYALKYENSFGKTEMWYIVEAEEGAGIYLGFKNDVTKQEYELAIKENRLTELLNFYPVKSGECYFIPSGTVHAIGKGCLICEIQQNSNLTYRVYDYGRVDKNGNPRELHVEKALKVSNLQRHENNVLIGQTIGASKYFSVKKLSGNNLILAPKNSFQCVTCISGYGTIDGQTISKGDSYFVPANHKEYIIKGSVEILLTEIRKYYVGIDLGGTFIKGGIVDDLGNILVSNKVPTESQKGDKAVALNISNLVKSLLKSANLTENDVVGVGIGVPGMIDSQNGLVIYSNNLDWYDFKIASEVERLTNLPVKIANDANVAALGETKFGCGKDYNNTVLVTLGTGVGGGIIIDGKLFEGTRGAGAELGHSVIMAGGEECTCGRKGCLEAYASATALIRDTKRAMLNNKDSKMWQVGSLENVDGKTAFDFMNVDETAKHVVDNYINALAVGLTNIANVFRPQVIMLGGGVSAQGEELTKPLQELLNKNIFAGSKGPQVKILTATLGNSAGLLGAAALLMD